MYIKNLNYARKIKLIVLSIFLALFLNSCVLAAVLVGGAIVAGGTVYYINGNYIIEVPKELRTVYNATIKSIQMDRKYSLINQTFDSQSAVVIASQGSDKISINLNSIKNRSTEIKIRVGTLGDEKRSAELANDITRNIT